MSGLIKLQGEEVPIVKRLRSISARYQELADEVRRQAEERNIVMEPAIERLANPPQGYSTELGEE